MSIYRDIDISQTVQNYRKFTLKYQVLRNTLNYMCIQFQYLKGMFNTGEGKT